MVTLRPETLGCSPLPASRSLSGQLAALPKCSYLCVGAGGGGRAGPGIKGTLYLIWSLTGYFQMQLKASNYSYGYY